MAVTRVDFYVLGQGADMDARDRFVARLTQRARRDQLRVYIHVPTAADASRLDGVLWEHPEGAFLPHGIVGSPEAARAPVRIGHAAPPADEHEMLINLGEQIPEFFSSFARVAEVVAGDQAARARSREHFRFYRDRGYPLGHHEVP